MHILIKPYPAAAPFSSKDYNDNHPTYDITIDDYKTYEKLPEKQACEFLLQTLRDYDVVGVYDIFYTSNLTEYNGSSYRILVQTIYSEKHCKIIE